MAAADSAKDWTGGFVLHEVHEVHEVVSEVCAMLRQEAVPTEAVALPNANETQATDLKESYDHVHMCAFFEQ